MGYAQVAKRNPESLISCTKENEHSLRLAPQNAHLFFPWLSPLSCLSSRSFKRLRYFKRIYCQRRPVGKFEAFELSIFTGSCFACGISLPLCFIIAQVPKQKKNTWNPVLRKRCCWPFFPTVRCALFLVHACPVPTSWLNYLSLKNNKHIVEDNFVQTLLLQIYVLLYIHHHNKIATTPLWH